jgi:hypothetical protein
MHTHVNLVANDEMTPTACRQSKYGPNDESLGIAQNPGSDPSSSGSVTELQ